MNSGYSETSHRHRLILTDKIDLRGGETSCFIKS